ncbi:hypothetical protein [Haloarcula marina]|uniref:hypothetical protein n=1 Tax=Haloarcula marina TaxID=2961574 RepID=UPI0020B8433B|nr:hypothetical protein [Halomicroarcula marina]
MVGKRHVWTTTLPSTGRSTARPLSSSPPSVSRRSPSPTPGRQHYGLIVAATALLYLGVSLLESAFDADHGEREGVE